MARSEGPLPCSRPGCRNTRPQGNSKYCAECSPKASVLRKRAERARLTAEFRKLRQDLALRRGEDAPGGQIPHWLDAWNKKARPGETAREAYNAHYRDYMRGYRQRRRLRQLAAAPTKIAASAHCPEAEARP